MSGLQDLFSKSNSQFSSSNSSLRYEDKSATQAFAVKNDEKRKSNNGPIVASVVILYRYENSNPIELGKKGAAIVANTDNNSNSFCLICYEIKSRKLLLSITIHSNFILNVLAKNYIAFYDSKSNYFSMRFPKQTLLEKFVTGIVMSKIPKIIPFNNSKNIIIQDLNDIANDDDGDGDDGDGDVINSNLQIWLCDAANHPFSKGEMVFNSEKILKLNSENKILPALAKALKPTKLNMKKLIIASSHYGFAQKGNKTLNIPPNSPLIIQIVVKSINKLTNNCNSPQPPQITPTPQTPQTQTQRQPVPTDDINTNQSTKERMARLSATAGGAMLATLIAPHPPPPHPQVASPEMNMNINEGNNNNNYYQPPPPQQPPPQQQQQQQQQYAMPAMAAMAAPITITLSSLHCKLEDICGELRYLRSVAPKKNENEYCKISASDVILCLNDVCDDLSESKSIASTQKLEIQTLNIKINTLKSKNHKLLEKNNNLMEEQYKSMSSTHDETLTLRKENIQIKNDLNLLKQENFKNLNDLKSIKLENLSIKEKLNNLLTTLNESQSELRFADENITNLSNNNEKYISEIKLLETKLNEMDEMHQRQEKEENRQEKEKKLLIAEKNQSIENLESVNNKFEEKLETISCQLSESQNECKEILNQSKKHIEKMKKKFEMHQIDLIKRILEFVYLKYDANIKANEDKFNYISFFRGITKEILLNPNDFDDDDDEYDESDNGEEDNERESD